MSLFKMNQNPNSNIGYVDESKAMLSKEQLLEVERLENEIDKTNEEIMKNSLNYKEFKEKSLEANREKTKRIFEIYDKAEK